jgi:hypothetical protein
MPPPTRAHRSRVGSYCCRRLLPPAAAVVDERRRGRASSSARERDVRPPVRPSCLPFRARARERGLGARGPRLRMKELLDSFEYEGTGGHDILTLMLKDAAAGGIPLSPCCRRRVKEPLQTV